MKKIKSTLLLAILFAATVFTVSAFKATEFKWHYTCTTSYGKQFTINVSKEWTQAQYSTWKAVCDFLNCPQ